MELCIATDLSAPSSAAAQVAFAWARRCGASVVLVHVVHDPELAPALGNDVPGDVARVRAELQRFCAEHGRGLACRVDVRTAEDVAAEIVRAAAGADYLFVGSRGRSGLQRLTLGSVAMAVLRQSHVPVVCVPAN